MKVEDQNAIKIDDYGENIRLSSLKKPKIKKLFALPLFSVWDIFSNDLVVKR